jgi:hypothetical protein
VKDAMSARAAIAARRVKLCMVSLLAVIWRIARLAVFEFPAARAGKQMRS